MMLKLLSAFVLSTLCIMATEKSEMESSPFEPRSTSWDKRVLKPVTEEHAVDVAKRSGLNPKAKPYIDLRTSEVAKNSHLSPMAPSFVPKTHFTSPVSTGSMDERMDSDHSGVLGTVSPCDVRKVPEGVPPLNFANLPLVPQKPKARVLETVEAAKLLGANAQVLPTDTEVFEMDDDRPKNADAAELPALRSTFGICMITSSPSQAGTKSVQSLRGKRPPLAPIQKKPQ